jgi:hypothetical protein
VQGTTLTISGSSTKSLGRLLRNFGTVRYSAFPSFSHSGLCDYIIQLCWWQVSWVGGSIYQYNASVFDNAANGTLMLDAAAGWYPSPSNGPASLINYGNISKSSQATTLLYTKITPPHSNP